ncbi:MAG: ComEC/Rec2 family competence protein, partial [Pseudomonadales bacterium]|nr:ComEC/Rec2 family competence protein [Pseudomonadales bacterium]
MFKILSVLAGVISLCFCENLIFAIQNQRWLFSFFSISSPLLAFIFLALFLGLLRFLLQRYLSGLNEIVSNHLSHDSFKYTINFDKTGFTTSIDCLILFLLAAIYAQSVAQLQLDSRLPSNLDGADIVISGTIIGLVERHELDSYRQQNFYQKFLFKVDQFDTASVSDLDDETEGDGEGKGKGGENHYRPRLIQINNYQYVDLKSGQQWQFTVRLKQPRGNSNPGGFDYVRYLFAQRIDATAYIRSENPSQLIHQGRSRWLTSIRGSRVTALAEPLSSLKNEGLLKALLLGDRSDLNPQDKQLLKRTGTSHLLAISGLHIGIAALFAALLVKGLLWCLPYTMHYWPRVIIVAVAALPIACFYAIVAGFSLSTRRALIMLSCFLVIVLLRRKTYLLQTLTLAALAIVIIDPLSVLSAGFWFSFSAVAILLWASRAMRFSDTIMTNKRSKVSAMPVSKSIWRFNFNNKSKEKLIVFGMAQLAIFIAMPLVLSLFTGQGSLLTPMANLLAIPIVSLAVVPAGIAGLLASYVSLPLATFLFKMADFFLNWILFLLNSLENFASMLRYGPLNFDVLAYQSSLNPIIFSIALVSIIILLGKRRLPAYSAAVIIWVVIFNPLNLVIDSRQAALEEGDMTVTQLDVGQGSAILL